ncbi:MAG: glycosyltransferase family 2 protein [Phycisphaeraceae bacterium]|nr:glycosyltransferase family 2 protein [Phycisphaeraceae bacterium]
MNHETTLNQQEIETPAVTGRSDAPTPGSVQPVYSVVVPCYNEEGAILRTIAMIKEVTADLPATEVIIVNDCSTDSSGTVLDEAAASDPALQVIHHRVNRGYGAALKTGIRRARGEWVAITDADGTYPNERLPEFFLRARHQRIDMLVGSRTGDDVTYSTLRKIPKYFLRAYCNWLTNEKIPDMNSGMRVLRRAVVDRFLNFLPDGFSFTTTITIAMLTSGYFVVYEPINYAQRIGKSKIRPIRDTINFVQLIVRTGTYFAPLRVFLPLAGILWLAFMVSLAIDIINFDVTQSTLLFLLFSLNTGMFALLADAMHRRGGV